MTEKLPEGHVLCVPMVSCTTAHGEISRGEEVALPAAHARSLSILGLIRIVGDGVGDVLEAVSDAAEAVSDAAAVVEEAVEALEQPAQVLQAAFPTAKRKRGAV